MNQPDHYPEDTTLPEGAARVRDFAAEIADLALVPLGNEKKREEFYRMYQSFNTQFSSACRDIHSLNNPIGTEVIWAFLHGIPAKDVRTGILHRLEMAITGQSGAPDYTTLAPELIKKVDMVFIALWKQTAERASNPDIMQ